MAKPKISIIIVNYRDEPLLFTCINSILKSSYKNIEIIVVNNQSSESFIKKIKKSKKIHLINNSLNLGFAKANNQGAEIATGEYLFFLNNDTKIKTDTIHLLSNEIVKSKKNAIVTGTILSYDGKQHLNSGIDIDIFGFPLNNQRLFYAEGSALMIDKEKFFEIGKFDETYFMFHEDIDLSWRAWLFGYKVICQKKAIIYHYSGKSAGGKIIKNQYHTTTFRRYYSEKNNIKTILKNYSLLYLILIMPLYCLINLAEIFCFLLVLKPEIAFLYFKAWQWNFSQLKSTIKQRKYIQQHRKISDKKIIKKMSFEIGKINVVRKIGLPIFN